MSTTTPIFAIGPAAYATVQGRRYLGMAALVLGVPFVACVAGAFVADDWRWLVVALAVATIAYPAVAALTWLALMANPCSALRCRPQRWTFCNNDAAEIEYFPPGTSCDDEPCEPIDKSVLDFVDVKAFEIRTQNAIFYLHGSGHPASEHIFILPASFLPVGLADKLYNQLNE